MKKSKPGQARTVCDPFPVTSMRLDPELLYRARGIVSKNKRDRTKSETTISQVLNVALFEYLKKREKRGA